MISHTGRDGRSVTERLLVDMPDLQNSLCLFDVSTMTTTYRTERQRACTRTRANGSSLNHLQATTKRSLARYCSLAYEQQDAPEHL